MFMIILYRFPCKATVGLDWADQQHDVFVRFANGDSYRQKIDSRPEAVQEWLLELRSACAEAKIAIDLEQRCGALFFELCNPFVLFEANLRLICLLQQICILKTLSCRSTSYFFSWPI
jgi:hypothetical protein